MLFHFMLRSLKGRKSRVVIALLAITLGNIVVAGLLNVYSSMDENMSRELRSYGANLVLTSSQPTDSFIDVDKIEQVNPFIPPDKRIGAAPILYSKGKIDDTDVEVIGIELDNIRAVAPYWNIEGEQSKLDSEQVLIGTGLAQSLQVRIGNQITVQVNEKLQSLQVVGIVSTGSVEDQQLFRNLTDVQTSQNQPGVVSYVLYSVVGDENELNELIQKTEEQVPGVSFSPVKQIVQAEGKVLVKIISIVSFFVLLILGSAFLCVLSTLLAMISERKKEIGLKKALGATDKIIAREFLLESMWIAVLGSVLGWGVGWFFARWVAMAVFQVEVDYEVYSFFVVLLLSIVMVLAAAWIPLKKLAQVNPAVVLKND